MTAYLKSRRSVFMTFFILCVLAMLTGCAEKQETQSPRDQEFVLLSTIDDEEFGLVTEEIKGNIIWFTKHDKNLRFDLEITGINREFENPKTKAQALKNQPFLAKVSLSKEEEIPLSIEITEGKFKDDPLGISTQYRTAYLILDMMLVTAVKKDFIVSKGDSASCSISLSVTPPDRVRAGDLGVSSVTGLRSSISPSKFLAFPRISRKLIKGWDLVYFPHDRLNINYFYRFLDKETGVATHAVNLEATARRKMGDENYTRMIGVIDDPLNFSSYELHELKVTTAEQGGKAKK